MIFENKVSVQFAVKVKDVAKRLGVKEDWLMAVMWSESRLNPSARNPTGGATGLIQFMPATAKYLGTSCDELARMNGVAQLDYVEKFFQPYAHRCRSFADLYLACFFPAAIGKPDSYVLQTPTLPAELIAKQNPLFDADKDGKITAGEFRKKLEILFPYETYGTLF